MSTATVEKITRPTAVEGPNQKYWDLGLDCFNRPEPSTIAMQKIWAAMLPPKSLPLLASIVGALYGNTYWENTKMNRAWLARDLRAALGINQRDCESAAAFAFRSWYGLLVRGNLADRGGIPRPGIVWQSPDVVVNANVALPLEQLIRRWDEFIYSPQPGLANYAYGRAQSLNIQVPITRPTLRMFYSPGGFNVPPTSWTQLFTFPPTSPTSPMQSINPCPGPLCPVQPGDKVANTNAFDFSPPGTGHYCLIAVVETEFFENDPLKSEGNWDSMEWTRNNGAVGWQNLNVAQSKQESLKFANQDGVPETFVFEARCSNVPKGTVVSLHCDDKRLAHPLDSHAVKISSAYQIVSAKAEIPPNFLGDLQVQFETPDGKLLPTGAAVDVSMDWCLARDHERYVDAVDLLGDTRALLAGRPVRIQMGSFTFLGKG